MKNITLKELVILFQEWQLETEAPNYNFTHNGVANNFIEKNGLENFLFCEKSDKGKINKESRFFANKLLDAGYSSCEVCFNVKLKRRGIMKWLENKKIIKPRTEGFALMIRDWDDVIIMSSAERVGVISITSTKVNGLH